jgi:hypothetical protein
MGRAVCALKGLTSQPGGISLIDIKPHCIVYIIRIGDADKEDYRWQKTEPTYGEVGARSEKAVYSRNHQARDLSVEEGESAWRYDGYEAVTVTALPAIFDGLRDCGRRRDSSVPRKDLLQQHPMRFLVSVGAAIADDQQSVVRVGGMA